MATVESKLFTFSGWDEISEGAMYFYDVTLVAPIGEFKKGDTFGGCMIDYENSVFVLQELTDNGEVVKDHKYHLSLNIGTKYPD